MTPSSAGWGLIFNKYFYYFWSFFYNDFISCNWTRKEWWFLWFPIVKVLEIAWSWQWYFFNRRWWTWTANKFDWINDFYYAWAWSWSRARWTTDIVLKKAFFYMLLNMIVRWIIRKIKFSTRPKKTKSDLMHKLANESHLVAKFEAKILNYLCWSHQGHGLLGFWFHQAHVTSSIGCSHSWKNGSPCLPSSYSWRGVSGQWNWGCFKTGKGAHK